MRLQSCPIMGPILLMSMATAQNTSSPSLTLPLSQDDSFNFEILAVLAIAPSSGADVGPVLATALQIEPGSFESFSEAFYTLANATKAQAEDPQNAYDPVNVRDTWFSVASYFRAADFYLHGDWTNPLINLLWEEQTDAFDQALASLTVPGKRVKISADNFTVEAIWYSSTAEEGAHRPTLILGNGYDGSQEDLYHTIVVPALARGWNCLTYEGPGQPSVRRSQNLGFIYDWERVVTPTIDYLLSEHADDVDETRLVLFGFSFGGYLAARAAAFDSRLAALILDGGVYDTYASYSSALSPELLELYLSNNQSAFDEFAESILNDPELPSSLRWGLGQGLWSFNTESAFDFLQKTSLYTLEGITDRIKIPVWIANAEAESFFPGQSAQVAAALGDRATLHNFTGAAGYHCQVGAFQELSRTMFAWLNQTVG
jgi:pimeloyl-ACP methyl ester carboxylesterase